MRMPAGVMRSHSSDNDDNDVTHGMGMITLARRQRQDDAHGQCHGSTTSSSTITRGGTDVRASWCDDNDDKMTPMALCHDGTTSSSTMTTTGGMDARASWCDEDAKDDDDNADGQHHGSTW